MAARILIVPGTNAILARIARQLETNTEVQVVDSANAALWQVRRGPPRILLSDTQLADIGGAELIEIVAALNRGVRLILCGQTSPDLTRAAEAGGAQLIAQEGSPNQLLWRVYQALGIAPPARPPTEDLSGKGSETPDVAQRPVQSHPPRAAATTAAGAPRPQQPAAAPGTSAATPGRATAVGGGHRPAGAPATAPRPAPAAAEPWMPRAGAQVIQPRQMAVIQQLLEALRNEVGSQTALLSDMVGMRLLEVGTAPPAFGPAVEPLLATSFSTAAQLAQQLKEPESRTLYLHEGVRYDIYAFNVGQHFILTLIFDKNLNPGKPGSVWAYAKRAARQLESILEK